ncbi:MAG TPA: ABC transporter ATP-binding protein, partial [Candidatus Ornithospirochaeta stercorigallinarum]|nr:ABC transporter ATP-binding protein [Candidatus Ornithospirochaeta stercorigallinarum]
REKEEKRAAESNKVVEQRTRKEEKKRLSFREQREYELLQKEIEGLEKEVAELEESFSSMDSRDYEKLLKAQSDYEEKNNLLNEKIERFLELDERA